MTDKKKEVNPLEARVEKLEAELAQLRKEYNIVIDKMYKMGWLEQNVQNFTNGTIIG